MGSFKTRLCGYVEGELAQQINEYHRELGAKGKTLGFSDTLPRVLIEGLEVIKKERKGKVEEINDIKKLISHYSKKA